MDSFFNLPIVVRAELCRPCVSLGRETIFVTDIDFIPEKKGFGFPFLIRQSLPRLVSFLAFSCTLSSSFSYKGQKPPGFPGLTQRTNLSSP